MRKYREVGLVIVLFLLVLGGGYLASGKVDARMGSLGSLIGWLIG